MQLDLMPYQDQVLKVIMQEEQAVEGSMRHHFIELPLPQQVGLWSYLVQA